MTMFRTVVFSLSILMAEGHILGSRLARRQTAVLKNTTAASIMVGRNRVEPEGKPRPSAGKFEPSDRTVIIIEFANMNFDEVYLKGGFVNGSQDKCAGSASMDDPCSIPIEHLMPSSGDDYYRTSAIGDNFLDMYGPEANQAPNSPSDKPALGTPTRKMTASEALNLAKSNFLWERRQNSSFWVVELKMNCSHTGGLFEVQAVTESASPEPDRRMRDRGLNPMQFSGFIPRVNPSMKGGEHGRFAIPGLEKWFTDDIKSSLQSISRSLRKDPVTEAKPVTVQTSRLNRRAANRGYDRDATRTSRHRSRKRMEQLPCSGDIHFLAPYNPPGLTVVGLCGYANIFTYNTKNIFRQNKGICEINALT